jgi:hypothetical protein
LKKNWNFKSLEESAFQYSIIFIEKTDILAEDREEFKNKQEFLLEHPAHSHAVEFYF